MYVGISRCVSDKQINYCRRRRVRQIIDLPDTDISRFSAITSFNNCFIIRSQGLFSLIAQGSDLPFFTQEHGFNYSCRMSIAAKHI